MELRDAILPLPLGNGQDGNMNSALAELRVGLKPFLEGKWLPSAKADGN